MTCVDCELLLAEGQTAGSVEAHLARCEDCRALAEDLRANAAALASMRDEPMWGRPPGLPRVPRPARLPMWRWPAAAAAALILAAVPYLNRTAPPVLNPRPTAAAMPTIAPVAARPPKPPAPRRAPQPPPAAEPMLVKMLTDDPNVVIYWLIEPNQGE